MKTKHFLELYEEIFTMKEEKLVRSLVITLRELGYRVSTRDKFLYGRPPRDHEVPVMLVAHVDTHHTKPPQTVYRDLRHGVLWTPEGLGADDRAGVAAILEILRRGYRPYVLFTDEEESGGGGARQASTALTLPKRIKYLIQVDRRNSDEAVFYDDDNEEFHRYIEGWGWNKQYGSFSDISILCPNWGISGVNVSAGYFNEHSKHEYMSIPCWERSVNRITEMLKSPPVKRFYYVEGVTTYRTPYRYRGAYGSIWWEYDELEYGVYGRGTSYELGGEYGEKYSVTASITAFSLSDQYGGTTQFWRKILARLEEELEAEGETAMYDLIEDHIVSDPEILSEMDGEEADIEQDT